jgi:hypothetical protein
VSGEPRCRLCGKSHWRIHPCAEQIKFWPVGASMTVIEESSEAPGGLIRMTWTRLDEKP